MKVEQLEVLWSLERQCVQAEIVRWGSDECLSVTGVREQIVVHYQGTRIVNRQPANSDGSWSRVE